jgi:hypothetical protein
VILNPFGTSATVSSIVPAPDDDDNDDDDDDDDYYYYYYYYGCEAVCGMRIGGGNPSARRKPATAPLRPPQITHDLT